MLIVIVVLAAVQKGKLWIGQLLFLRNVLKLESIPGHEFRQFVDDSARLRI